MRALGAVDKEKQRCSESEGEGESESGAVTAVTGAGGVWSWGQAVVRHSAVEWWHQGIVIWWQGIVIMAVILDAACVWNATVPSNTHLNEHPRLPLILKHNEFVKSTFMAVLVVISSMLIGLLTATNSCTGRIETSVCEQAADISRGTAVNSSRQTSVCKAAS